MIQQEISFQSKDGKVFNGTLRIPREDGKYPGVLICHGFLENKDVGLIADIANGLSYYGFVTYRFNFLYEGDVAKTGLEQMTLTQQVEDIRDAIEFLKTIPQVDTRRIILMGHDLGGVSCLLANHEEIDGIILLNVRVDTKAFLMSYITELDLKEWLKTSWITLMDVNLHKDVYKDMVRYDVIKEIKDEKVPILIIHGTNDKRCPTEDARTLFQNAKNAHLELIDGADHYFSDSQQKLYAIQMISDWIGKILGT